MILEIKLKNYQNALKKKINEDETVPSSYDNVGYGVQGDMKADSDKDSKKIIQKDNIIDDDKSTLDKIAYKVDANINSLEELNSYLESYSKVNNKALSAIIAKLKRFKEAVSIESKQQQEN